MGIGDSTADMRVTLLTLLLSILASSLAQTTDRPRCPNFQCPNQDEEGGLFQTAPCSPDFCDCSYGVPYLLTCNSPLFFDESAGVCNWCFNMCDKCSEHCSGC